MPDRRRPNPSIIGYAFNAALCCPNCTIYAFSTGELRRPILPPKLEPLDQHGLPEDMCNTYDEPVNPVFSTDDYPDGFTCDECGELQP